MIEDIDIDEIFSYSQKQKILNSNKRRSFYASEFTKEGESTDEDLSTRISAPDIAMDDEEKEIVKN